MGVEDKEYPVKVTDEMINKYEDMVYKVYLKSFASKYYYLRDDLLQCGRWGVFLAYQRYETRAKGKCSFTLYTWLNIRTKMGHYIKHERNHIVYEIDEGYDFSELENEPRLSKTTKIDIDRILSSLPPKDYYQIVQWANDTRFEDMGFNTRQNSHTHFKRTLRKLKEKLDGYEL